MSKGGGSQNSTVTQNADPWSGVQPYLKEQLSQAQNLYQGGQLAPQYYPGQTIANQSPFTQQAISLLGNRAANGSPVTTASQNQVADTLNGNYLDPQNNPYFKGALNNVADAYARGTGAQTAGAFNKAGAYGGSAMQETQGANNQAFANSLLDLGNTQYQQGRTQQLQAAALAPQTANQDYTNLAGLAQAGSSQDQYQQSLLNDQLSRYNYNSQLPFNALSSYKNLTSGTGGGSSTTTQPYYGNNSALGTGLGLLGSSNSLGGSAGMGAGLLSGLNSAGMSLLPGAFDIGAALTGLPWSDRRLKEDITEIGEEKGFPVYTFRYKDDPTQTRYRGVMAQDVVKTHPEAVYMMVDYSKLGVEFRPVT